LDYWIIGLLIQDVTSVVDIGDHIVGEAANAAKQGLWSDVSSRCWTATQELEETASPEDISFYPSSS